MRILRTVAASAIVWGLAIVNVGAQTTAISAPHPPFLVLKVVTQPEKAQTKLHGRQTGKVAGKGHLAAAKTKAPQLLRTDQTETSEPATLPPIDITSTVETLEMSAGEPEPSEQVVEGRSVQELPPDDTNQIDVAAATPNSTAVPTPASYVAMADPVRTVAAGSAERDLNPVGSAARIAQVLAALGGAVAAGLVAWLLMGSTPQRTYG